MAGARAPLTALLLALLWIGWPRAAGAVAPYYDWQTLPTARCRVHFHEGGRPIAEHVAELAEEIIDHLADHLGHAPSEPIQIVLTDESDGANGFANVLPYNLVTLYLSVPDPDSGLGDYDDYFRMLLSHELTHIMHLDTIGGLPAAFNAIFGKLVAPNLYQPLWFVEGLAVYFESRLTGQGRIRSAEFDMLMREQLLADRFPRLDEFSTQMRRYPGGNARYVFGGRLIDFIGRRYGGEALARISAIYGARALPYGINLVAEEALGKNYPELWQAWKEDEQELADRTLGPVYEAGLRLGRRVDHPAEFIRHPRFAPNGALALVVSPRDDDMAIEVHQNVSLDTAPGTGGQLSLGPSLLKARTTDGEGAFTADGAHYVAVITDLVGQRFNRRDLEIVEVSSGHRRRRTHGARLADPDVSPSGTIVAVGQDLNQSRLMTLSVEGDDPPKLLLALPFGQHLFAPHWSPDGQQIVASLGRLGGGRQLVLIDPESAAIKPLTETRAHDDAPIWTPDGRSIIFSSDRTRISNLYRLDLASGAITQLTNVETGAFDPAIDPSGRRLAFACGTIDGFELRILELDPARELAPGSIAVRSAVTASATAIAHQPESYSPWETLIPRTYLPTTASDSFGDTIGIRVDGVDALAYHSYQLVLSYGLKSERLGYSFSYSNHNSIIPISIGTSLGVTDRPNSFATPLPGNDLVSSIWRGSIGIEIPFNAWDLSDVLSLSYSVELRRPISAPPLDPFQGAPSGAGPVNLAALGASWYLSNTRGFADSISSAAGFGYDLGFRLNHPALGSDLKVLELTSHAIGFVSMPWIKHHVLALRLAGGVSVGDAEGRSVYSLGGLPIRNILADAIQNLRFGADNIRGYGVNALRGSSFYLANLEYRFPLRNFERGIDTLPAFVDRLRGTIFSDAGDTPSSRLDPANLRVGVGAELLLDLIFGYSALPLTARIGYARGVTRGGVDNAYLVLGGGF